MPAKAGYDASARAAHRATPGSRSEQPKRRFVVDYSHARSCRLACKALATPQPTSLLVTGESDSAGLRVGGGVPPPSAGDLGGCGGGHSGRAVLANSRLQDRRRRPEALERAIDAEEELPQ